MGKIMNSIALTFSVIVGLFFGLSALGGGFADLTNANMTMPANNTVSLIQSLLYPSLGVIPGIVWLLMIALIVVVFAVVWRWW